MGKDTYETLVEKSAKVGSMEMLEGLERENPLFSSVVNNMRSTGFENTFRDSVVKPILFSYRLGALMAVLYTETFLNSVRKSSTGEMDIESAMKTLDEVREYMNTVSEGLKALGGRTLE